MRVMFVREVPLITNIKYYDSQIGHHFTIDERE